MRTFRGGEMANELETAVGIQDITRSITVHVKLVGYRSWLIRKVIAMFLIRAGIWLLGMPFVTEEADAESGRDGGRE